MYRPDYDFHYTVIKGRRSSRSLICLHGMGGNYLQAALLQENSSLDCDFISFNFPDHDLPTPYDAHQTSFGTPNEILPIVYVLKKCILEEQLPNVDLYGFSAGGGALINTIAALNSTKFDPELAKIGIAHKEKIIILAAMQKGFILLDAPLRSIEEIIAFRGHAADLDIYQKRYVQNDMVPLEAIKRWHGLALSVLLCLPTKDEVLSNRDDQKIVDALQRENAQGKTYIIYEPINSRHSDFHAALFAKYKSLISGNESTN